MTADQYASRIYAQAIAGTPYNNGVPVALAELMVAQARHETANFTSHLFTAYNNAFGYDYFGSSNYQTGPGSAADNGVDIGVYASVEDSTMEMVDWLWRRYHGGQFPDLQSITTPDQYAALLKKVGYYGDSLSNYLAGLVRWFTPMATASGVWLLVAAAVIYYFRKQIF